MIVQCVKKYYLHKRPIYSSLLCSLLCLLLFITYLYISIHSKTHNILQDTLVYFFTYVSFGICLMVTICYYYKYKGESERENENIEDGYILLDNV